MANTNRMTLLDIPVTGRIDELDEIPTFEAFKARQAASNFDSTNGFEHDALYAFMYLPLGFNGTYTIEGQDGPPVEGVTGPDYGTAVFTVEVTPAMSMFNIMELTWQWCSVNVWPHTHHVWFESAEVFHLLWVEEVEGGRGHWQPIQVIRFGMGS